MPPVNNQPLAPYTGPPVPPAASGSPRGSGNKTMLIAIALGVLFVSTLIFAFYAFTQMQDYKNNSDKKSAEAVKVAESAQAIKLNAEFAEKEKSPYKTYQSPADFASVKIVYPKTWGAYIDESSQGANPINGYFHPNFVPKTSGESPIALRVQVTSTSYEQSLNQYESGVSSGALKATPVTVEGVKGVTGMRFDGKITPKYTGSVVLFPIRDRTLKIWTEVPTNVTDFNNIVLKNLTFSP